MYRSAFIGTGFRAESHAAAYAAQDRLTLSAAADLDAARLQRFADRFGVPRTYNDYRRMLAQERPDVVHLVTNPNFRVEPVRACGEQAVKAVIVEKPLGLSLSDLDAIDRIAADSGMKVIVNTQRRYFASWRRMCEVSRSRDAGEVVFARIAALSPLFCTGSHYIDMIQMLLGDPDPVHVWATAYGAHEYHSTHPGPANALASVTYPRRVRLLYEASQDGVGERGSDEFFMSTRFDVATTRGRLWWTEVNGWGYQFEGMSKAAAFPTCFAEDDKAGQAAFTQAVADWLDDERRPHANRLETAGRVFRIMAAMVQSAAQGRRVAPHAELGDSAAELRAKLEAAEGVHPERQRWAWNPPPR